MKNGLDEAEARKILSDSHDEAALLMKAAAHPARIKVLTRLLQGARSHAQLMDATSLSKTAVSNHLHQLVHRGLVERVSRGQYQLTPEGKDLAMASAALTRRSQLREDAQRRRLLQAYRRGLSKETITEKIISRPAVYLPCWLSYTGAMGGALRTLGLDCDTVDVGGQSGYSFLINTTKDVTCPSGPTAFNYRVWTEICRGTGELGRGVERYIDQSVNPENEEPGSEEYAGARRLFLKVKREIEKDLPVVLWGLVVPEYGIVNGYEETSYVVSTFRSLAGQSDDPVPFHDLNAPGCIHALTFRDKVELDRVERDRRALDRGVRFASGDIPVNRGYSMGIDAFSTWADILENGEPESLNYHGNSYMAACYREARQMSKDFLGRLARRNPRAAEPLELASKSYGKVAGRLTQFTKIFPFAPQGEMREADRVEGAELLRKALKPEEEAIEHMRRAQKAL